MSLNTPRPELSIVVVSWNTLEMTAECLQSVIENLGDIEAELIVIDNASSDGSAEMIAQRFPDARLIVNRDNLGFAAANNQGFALARGRNILLLNSDTIVLGDVLGASLSYLAAHAEVGAMGCRVLNTDRTTQRTCSRYPTLLNIALLASGLHKFSRPAWLGRYQMRGWNRDSERDVEVISGCYLLLRREVLDQVGPLDEGFFFFGEETDWCKRIADAGWTLRFAPVGEIIHHGGGSVKKLNHRRDVMLTDALVGLHRKHGGAVPAAVAAGLLGGFNATRAVFWSVMAVLRRRPADRERARHFRNVVAATTWPKFRPNQG